MHLEASITIKRPPEDVFFALIDGEAHAKWGSGLESVTTTSDGPVGVGTTFRAVFKSMGRKFEVDGRFTEFEPNRRVATAAKTPYPGGFTYVLTPVDGGTRFDETFDAEPSGFFRLAQPLLVPMTRRQMQRDLETLRDMLENGTL